MLVSLVASNEGRLTHGETRMVMSERGRGALLQRSKSGNTVVVSELSAALDAVRNRPEDGVFWQVGTESLSAQLIKVSGGERRENEEISVQRVSRESSEIILPETEQNADKIPQSISVIFVNRTKPESVQKSHWRPTPGNHREKLQSRCQ